MDRKGFRGRFSLIVASVRRGQVSRSQAARELKIGYSTLKRLLEGLEQSGGEG
jgi:hypothetical protein